LGVTATLGGVVVDEVEAVVEAAGDSGVAGPPPPPQAGSVTITLWMAVNSRARLKFTVISRQCRNTDKKLFSRGNQILPSATSAVAKNAPGMRKNNGDNGVLVPVTIKAQSIVQSVKYCCVRLVKTAVARLGKAVNLYATPWDVQHRRNCRQISQGIYWPTGNFSNTIFSLYWQ
jgi:hypothetical protein